MEENKDEIPKNGNDTVLEFIWGQFRTWDVTSIKLKGTLTKWRWRVFVFVIVSAFSGVLSQQLITDDVELAEYFGFVSQALGVISGLAIALAAYAGSEILTEELEKNSIRTRSIAEALKTEAYLYLLKAPPYHLSTATQRVFKRSEQLMKTISDVPSFTITKEEALTYIPSSKLTVEEYIEERIRDQAYNYYLPKAQYYQNILKKGKTVSYILGFGGVILGTAASVGYSNAPVWIAFISATTASITSYLSSNRYQYLVVSFQASANRLIMLLAKWHQIDRSDMPAQRRFIQECEATISIENSAWMAELSDNKDEETEAEKPTT